MRTTDGKQFVYGVFGADGCECTSLEAIFEDESAAVEFAEKLIAEYSEDAYTFYGEPEHLSVEVIEVGKHIDPLGKNTVWPAGEDSQP